MISFHPTAKIPETPERGFKFGFNLLSVITKNVWSGIVWEGGRRKKEFFVSSDYCVFDFDEAEPTLDQAVNNIFCDYAHVIGTTRNHQKSKNGEPPCDKFRIVIPWSKRITDPKVYYYNMVKLVDKYGADKKCKDLGRLFFPCVSVISSCSDGYRMNVLEPPDGWGAPKPVDQTIVGTGILPSFLQRLLFEPAKQGEIKNTYFLIGCTLSRLGYSEDIAVEIAKRGSVWKKAKAADPIRELEGHVRRGWNTAREDEGQK